MIALLAFSATACTTTTEMLEAALAYESAQWPEANARLDLPYRADAEADPVQHRLDLYLPSDAVSGWPTLIFVHGGGWTSGDRAMSVFGIEPIRNIGRFYAARGFGVALLSYRLQPKVSFREQIEDVAQATDWVRREIATLGGDPSALFLGGHSAGAWLAAWVGASAAPLAPLAMDRSDLCGLVLVSGAGYDLQDEETYRLGANRAFFEDLFGDDDPDWARAASIFAHLDAPLPDALILSASGERESFRRQGDLMAAAFRARGATATRVVIPGQDHQRILVSLSLETDPVSATTLDFLRTTKCAPGPA